MKFYPKDSFLIVFMLLLFVASSCGDDENNGASCNQLYSKIGVATGDLLSSDCEVRVEAYEKLITLYGEGKNCKEIKEGVEDEGYDSVDDFIAELQENRDEEEAGCTP